MNKNEIKELDMFTRRICAKDKKERFNKFAILLNILFLILGLSYALTIVSCEGFTNINGMMILVNIVPLLLIKHFRYKLWKNRESIMLKLLEDINKNKKEVF